MGTVRRARLPTPVAGRATGKSAGSEAELALYRRTPGMSWSDRTGLPLVAGHGPSGPPGLDGNQGGGPVTSFHTGASSPTRSLTPRLLTRDP
jgi:hypothetical protein